MLVCASSVPTSVPTLKELGENSELYWSSNVKLTKINELPYYLKIHKNTFPVENNISFAFFLQKRQKRS